MSTPSTVLNETTVSSVNLVVREWQADPVAVVTVVVLRNVLVLECSILSQLILYNTPAAEVEPAVTLHTDLQTDLTSPDWSPIFPSGLPAGLCPPRYGFYSRVARPYPAGA